MADTPGHAALTLYRAALPSLRASANPPGASFPLRLWRHPFYGAM